MDLTYEYKENHIIVYGDGHDVLGIKVRAKLGKIKYYSFDNNYHFIPGWFLGSICEESIEELNNKIKQLRKIRDRRLR